MFYIEELILVISFDLKLHFVLVFRFCLGHKPASVFVMETFTSKISAVAMEHS